MILTNENNIGTEFKEVDIIESFDDIINRFPSPTETGMPGLKIGMPGLKIYGDNTDQSKAKNIKLYNDAQQWRKDYLSHNGLDDTGQGIVINVDAVLIDNIIMDKYDGDYDFHDHIMWYIVIYINRIWLYINDMIFMSVYIDGSIKFLHYNIFPSPGETRMPALKIYGNNKDQDDKKQNIELYNNAQRWRISHNILNYGWSDLGRQPIRMYIDELIIDGSIIDEYDKGYNYYIDIYDGHIDLENTGDHDKFLTISKDGSVNVHIMPTPLIFNKFPTPTDTFMPRLKIYTNYTHDFKSKNIKLYNDAIQWRKDYISYNGLGDTGQAIFMDVDALMIDGETIDKYDGKYNYYIGIHDDSIILLKNYDLEILTISSDGSVQLLFNKFPTPTDTYTFIPGIKIYTDNTDKSKAENIKLYNDAQEYRDNYGYDHVMIGIDALIIDDTINDNYDGHYEYAISVYNDRIILLYIIENWMPILTISGDGFVTINDPAWFNY